MNAARIVLAVPLFLTLTACGDDPREQYSGSYAYSGKLTYVLGDGNDVYPMDGRFDLVADHFDEKRLFLSLDCGLNLTVEEDFVKLTTRICPMEPDSNCIYTARYERGSAKVTGDTLTLDINGAVEAKCGNETFRAPFTMDLEGKRRATVTESPGGASVGKEPLHQRLLLPAAR